MPPFTLPSRTAPSPNDQALLQPSGGRAPAKPLPAEAQGPTNTPETAPAPMPDPIDTGGRTRGFERTYDTSPSVGGPLGPMNVGYVHNVVSTNGQWARGELPDLGYGYTFALRRPKLMREPRTDLGSYNLARG